VDSLHIKKIDIEDLVGYVYIVRVDSRKSNKDPNKDMKKLTNFQ
jgi:hypothetical protein